jgi:NADPH:quinone reductase-like Zn-dependent oxidoreductase
LFRQTPIRGIAVAPRSSFDRINAFLDKHQIRHVIDQTYSFNDVLKAFEHLARDASGKVVINVF